MFKTKRSLAETIMQNQNSSDEAKIILKESEEKIIKVAT